VVVMTKKRMQFAGGKNGPRGKGEREGFQADLMKQNSCGKKGSETMPMGEKSRKKLPFSFPHKTKKKKMFKTSTRKTSDIQRIKRQHELEKPGRPKLGGGGKGGDDSQIKKIAFRVNTITGPISGEKKEDFHCLQVENGHPYVGMAVREREETHIVVEKLPCGEQNKKAAKEYVYNAHRPGDF